MDIQWDKRMDGLTDQKVAYRVALHATRNDYEMV